MTRVALYPEDELLRIVKYGAERARYGQTNTREAQSPFSTKRQIKPREPLSRAVAEMLPQLEFQKFHAMVDPTEWKRLAEVKDLALEQIIDDYTGNQISYQKVGRKVVEPLNDHLDHDEMYPELTLKQRALSEGLAPYLLRLTEVQQETLRYRFFQKLSQAATGKELGVGKKSVEMNETRGITALRKHLLEAYPAEPEAPPSDPSGNGAGVAGGNGATSAEVEKAPEAQPEEAQHAD